MVLVHGAGEEAVLPQMPAAPVQPVDVLRVQKMGPAEGLCKRRLVFGHPHHMNMIGHQAVAVNPESKAQRLSVQQFEIDMPVIIDKKHVRFIVAPLRDMMGSARNNYSCNSRHSDRLPEFPKRVNNKW